MILVFIALTSSPKEAADVDPEPRIGGAAEAHPRGRETPPVPVYREWQHLVPTQPGTRPVSW